MLKGVIDEEGGQPPNYRPWAGGFFLVARRRQRQPRAAAWAQRERGARLLCFAARPPDSAPASSLPPPPTLNDSSFSLPRSDTFPSADSYIAVVLARPGSHPGLYSPLARHLPPYSPSPSTSHTINSTHDNRPPRAVASVRSAGPDARQAAPPAVVGSPASSDHVIPLDVDLVVVAPLTRGLAEQAPA